ncbi:uncharacterized protein LOC111236501 [Seriola dumerili]|uniref:uncharacterized protein LOC111236501 n=1 Tax=Seriola dumerili TaxID=41447 RepID=UPI000BBF0745|nr:uncharacterized protein LOC111236501 [Seriola dumerili]
MFACETPILQRLVVLVVCHGFAVGQTASRYNLIQTPMPWSKAREFCQKHHVDLAVLNAEEQYFTLLNATHANQASFWLGLQRQSIFSGWTWVNGEVLSYEYWYRRNYEGLCASLEAMLKKEKKLLARYCDEPHMFVCQGPVSPQPVAVDSVSTDQLNLSWNVSAFMQMTPHGYNVTACNSTCDTLLYSYTGGSASMSINISNLTSATEYFIKIAAFVVRPDSVTSGKMIFQSNPTALQVKTADSFQQSKVITVILKSLKLMSLGPPLWILYCILRKDKPLFLDDDDDDDADHEVSSVDLLTVDTVIELIPEKTRGIN